MDFVRDERAPKKADRGDASENKAPSDQVQESKDKRRKKCRLSTGSIDLTHDDSTPVAAALEHKRKKRHSEASGSKSRKRKRKSEAQSQLPDEGLEGHTSALSDVKSTTPNSGDKPARSKDASDKPAKKKIKSHRKSADINTSVAQSEAMRENTPTVDQVKKTKKTKSLQPQLPAPEASPYITTPKKTPIPLPQKMSTRRTTTPALPQVIPPAQDVDVIVVETPPSKLTSASSTVWKTPTQTPIFPPLLESVEMKETAKLTKDNLKLSRGAPKASLNGQANTQQRYRRSSSVSSASSVSIKDGFLRINKSSLAGDDIDDPFIISTPTPERRIGGKSGKLSFDTALEAFRVFVDFAKEKEYMTKFLEKRIADDYLGPLPCLHQTTGCSLAKEKALALVHADNSDPQTLVDSNASSITEQIGRSVGSYLEAERFLSNAMLVSMPVPAGKIEGTYTLYCPKYLQDHVDKYADGARTITITHPSGFKSTTFTARLDLPPRPMPFNVRAFKVPAHASFKAIELLTTDEEVELELSVMGNGYIALRMDLGLLLRGRRSERDPKKGGDATGEGVVMEFYGVKKKDGEVGGAVEWRGVEEELEEKYAAEGKERKKRAAKEKEGGVEEKAEVVAPAPPGTPGTPATPKKRGRPSKADLERRAKEKEMEARGGV